MNKYIYQIVMSHTESLIFAGIILAGFAGMMIAFWIYCHRQMERKPRNKKNGKNKKTE